ncbi:xanthine dehydrogenase accessory protein XdhC [Rhodobacter sp. TJ_12]|uniref:xanthine dehydrogenase accessory protein XdhC n=1 Tax=Rhodobacter sp. TJ_12 TaxID=2029399 RepID=UPI001CBAEB4B|nr:xanthine dehydrogenase accessory protein XdhC [Rhodobacter sp. TJ_12]MBZ4023079.1 xanthine dehydrogenase accessory protein XdhC [Rhodobacter sp. TJ_12]
MSLRLDLLATATQRGPFVRLVVVGVKGSAPREVGAEMLVWPDQTQGTIGGGTLEFAAIAEARTLSRPQIKRFALGPDMGQCCGGAVRLAFEPITAQTLAGIDGPAFARPFRSADQMPLAIRKAMAEARRGALTGPVVHDNWLIEPIAPPPEPLWIWGAGHVGRALVDVIAPLPDWALSWADTGPERFPEQRPPGVTPLIAQNPADLVTLAPPHARHLIVTFSHALDLELCHRLLGRGFAGCGLIGSQTKWSRFRRRLAELGHSPAQISRIACPIGDPALGKAPQAIAISVAAALLRERNARAGTAAPTEGLTG